jgi:hypothetical protein
MDTTLSLRAPPSSPPTRDKETSSNHEPTLNAKMHHTSSPSSFERIENLEPRELLDYLTCERFFEPYSSQSKLKFQQAEMAGRTFLREC